MSNCWIGYTLVLEREPNFAEAEEALARIKELLEPLIVAVEKACDDSDTEMDVLLATVEDMLTSPGSECVDDEGEVRLCIARAEEALSAVLTQWPPMHNDGDFVYVGDKIVVYAGASSYGGEPDGEGYNLLRGLCMFKDVLKVLQGCGDGCSKCDGTKKLQCPACLGAHTEDCGECEGEGCEDCSGYGLFRCGECSEGKVLCPCDVARK